MASGGGEMQSAIRVQTKVQKGGKIEIHDPNLSAGEEVEVIVLLSKPIVESKYSVTEVLASTTGKRVFKTAEEVEQYIRNERVSWEN
jgi:hypothetical protein